LEYNVEYECKALLQTPCIAPPKALDAGEWECTYELENVHMEDKGAEI
jgi:hypothetical protein